MKKLILIISVLCLSLLLAGCIAEEKLEPSEELISTKVSLILTETALAEQFLPTETPALPLEEPEEEPTIEVSPTEIATSTPVPTETPDLTDPAVLLGDAAWSTDFSGDSSPWDYDSTQATFKTSNGALNLTAKANANYHNWYLSSPKLKNAYLEATIEMPTCSGSDRFGLAFRAGGADWDQFYFMGLTCDGQWGFFRMAPGVKIVQIIGYQSAEPLEEGMNVPHRVGVWMEGSDFSFYIDGKQVGSATDTELQSDGYTGFLIAFANTPGFTVKVDKLAYWHIK